MHLTVKSTSLGFLGVHILPKYMDLSSNLDEYIKESIEHSLDLPVSANTMKLKLLASEEAQRRLQDQIFLLQDQLKEKDQKIERSRVCIHLSLSFLGPFLLFSFTIWTILVVIFRRRRA